MNRDHESQSLSAIHQSSVTRRDVVGAFAAGSIVVVFCLILLRHDPLIFWNDDYELSILPVFADVARSWSEGHLPLLSPYSWACSNLAGEFQYGTFSIFINALVILIWKFPLNFPQQAAALSTTHLFVLAAGAFLLARNRRLSVTLSIFVALVAALNGWIICWGATDWFGAVGAFAWLPWTWWGLERALDRERTRWRFLWPAPFVYLLVTGGFPYTVLMLMLLLAWLSIKSLVQTKSLWSILPMLCGVGLGLGLAAPAWLAILDYVQGSARETQARAAHWQWIVPPSALPAFILPPWTVKWADFSTRMMPHTAAELACGLVPVPAIMAGLIGRGRALVRQIKWELVLVLLVLALAMLPSARVFRWSFRWLPFCHLILAICAGEALRLLPRSAIPATTALFLIGTSAITMSILHVTGQYAFPLTWILLVIATIWVFAEFFLSNGSVRDFIPGCVTFAALIATYLCIPPNCGVPKYNLSQQLTNPAPLDSQRLYLSVYPPAEHTYRVEKKSGPVGQTVRPGSTSMWGRLHFINGYSPILAGGVAREFKFAIHGEIDPDIGENLLEHEAGVNGELARLGIDGIVVARESVLEPQPSAEWELVALTEEGRVFHRQGAPLARIRSVPAIDFRPGEQFVPANISRVVESRNHVEADLDVPKGDRGALLTFSRPYFRGYIARMGDKKLAVDSYRGLFPMVELPAGSHGRLVLTYRPAWLIFGGGLSIFSAAIFAAGIVAAVRRSGRLISTRESFRSQSPAGGAPPS